MTIAKVSLSHSVSYQLREGLELSRQLKAQLFWHFRGSPRIETRKWDWAVSGGLSRTLPASFIGDRKITIINVFSVVMMDL